MKVVKRRRLGAVIGQVVVVVAAVGGLYLGMSAARGSRGLSPVQTVRSWFLSSDIERFAHDNLIMQQLAKSDPSSYELMKRHWSRRAAERRRTRSS